MKGYVYFLSEEKDGLPFYIGSTNNPVRRISGHRTNNKIYDPVKDELIKCDTNIEINIIEEVDVDDHLALFKLEVYWIHQFLAWGFELKNSRRYFSNKELKYTKPTNKGSCTILLKHIPADVYEYVKEIQSRIKAERGIKQFSLAETIYFIIREHAEMNKAVEWTQQKLFS